jgi:GDP-L-fucose synthase|tara:strand:+ start:2507 stop:3448 length:942 start_codon:yes stop_codon:yes gene_type:complete
MNKISLKNKKVFVAGHKGLVGQSLCRRLEKENCKILYVNKKSLDLRDFNKTDKWLKLNKPDYIFIAAARVGGILANSSYPADFIYDNLSIATNLIHLSHKNNIKKVLYLGSSCIYPKFSKQPINEELLLTGSLEPTNEWYAIAKIAGLKLCQAYSLQHKCNFISAMPTNLYGPEDNFDVKSGHVLPGLINKIHLAAKHNKKNVIIWGTGKPKREFLFVDDLADALVFLMKNYNKNDHINVGSRNEVNILNLAKIIAKVVGFKGKFIFDRSKPDGTPRKFINSKKINLLGWKSKTSLLKGIEITYRWYLKNKSK